MNNKILFSLMTIGIVAAGTGYATFAFFSDTETATDNIFTAGDLDLTLNGLNGITGTIIGTNLAPLDTVSGSIVLRNEGSIFQGDAQGHAVDLDFKAVVTTTDDAGNPLDPDDGGVSAVAFDRFLVLTVFTYDGSSLLGGVGDADADGRANTLNDLEVSGLKLDLADPLAAGKTLALTVEFVSVGANDLKRDSVDVDFTFFLAQAGETDLA